MQWFRLYDEMIDDPKVLSLSFESRWYYICLLSCASRHPRRGDLPDMTAISIHLRTSKPKAEKIVREFIGLGFIDANVAGSPLRIHGWDGRQFKSDDITARTGTFRERSRERVGNGHLNALETFPRADPRSGSGSVSGSVPVEGVQGEIPPNVENPPAAVASLAARSADRWPMQNADRQTGDLCRDFDYRLVSRILDQAFAMDPKRFPCQWVRKGCQNEIAGGWTIESEPSLNGTTYAEAVKTQAEKDAAELERRMAEWEERRAAKRG